MVTIEITREQLCDAQRTALAAMLGIRSLPDERLIDYLMTLYLEGFKAGAQSRKEATNDTQN